MHRSGPIVGDRGYGSVLALSMLLGGVLLLALASDVGRLVAAWQEASHVARTAAEVGAGWVDPDELYRGELVIDRAAARSASERFVTEQGLEATVEIASGRVCVTVRRSVRPGLIRLVGAGDQGVSARACAEPRQG